MHKRASSDGTAVMLWAFPAAKQGSFEYLKIFGLGLFSKVLLASPGVGMSE